MVSPIINDSDMILPFNFIFQLFSKSHCESDSITSNPGRHFSPVQVIGQLM